MPGSVSPSCAGYRSRKGILGVSTWNRFHLPFSEGHSLNLENVLTTGLGCNSGDNPSGSLVSFLVVEAFQRGNGDTQGHTRMSEKIVTEIDANMRTGFSSRIEEHEIAEFQIGILHRFTR